MNVLVIDDLIHVVKGIVAGVNWCEINVTNVFEAHNSIEAKRVIKENSVEIMVCDIEMPMGNGLELLEWVRQHYPKMKCIFLTSHSEFDYAQKAIKLGSFDYLLQPIKYNELEKVISKAIDQVNMEWQTHSYSHLWEENQETIHEKFWHDLLNGVYKDDLQKINNVAKNYNISTSSKTKYQLILINIMRREVLLSDWDDHLIKYTLTNILAELMEIEVETLHMIQLDSGRLAIVYEEQEAFEQFQLKTLLDVFIQISFRDIKYSLSCYISDLQVLSMLPEISKKLNEMAKDNVACYRKVFSLYGYHKKHDSELEIVELKRWETLLYQGQNEQILEEVSDFLYKLLDEGTLDSRTLFEFHQGFMKIFYLVYESKQLDSHHVFRKKEISDLYIKSLNSIFDMLAFIKYILSFKFDEENVETYYETSIDTLKGYIRENLEKNLTRNELAERVFLNADYLSRLFKKQTGISLSTFITNERVNMSKDFLIKTDMSISIIASKVGYSNFSHFSQVFKKITGSTPVEFRQAYR